MQVKLVLTMPELNSEQLNKLEKSLGNDRATRLTDQSIEIKGNTMVIQNCAETAEVLLKETRDFIKKELNLGK